MSDATERPILFRGPMVRAILQGRKTQTRRVVKNLDLIEDWDMLDGRTVDVGFSDEYGDWHKTADACPYGQPGDRLWVRECFGLHYGYVYRATNKTAPSGGWKPSIHMPRAASRITLEIVSVRVEMVQEITDEDALAEGVTLRGCTRFEGEPVLEYKYLWDSINSKRGYGWVCNPLVWVIEFRRVQ